MIVPGYYSLALLTVLEGSLIDHELKNMEQEAGNRKVTLYDNQWATCMFKNFYSLSVNPIYCSVLSIVWQFLHYPSSSCSMYQHRRRKPLPKFSWKLPPSSWWMEISRSSPGRALVHLLASNFKFTAVCLALFDNSYIIPLLAVWLISTEEENHCQSSPGSCHWAADEWTRSSPGRALVHLLAWGMLIGKVFKVTDSFFNPGEQDLCLLFLCLGGWCLTERNFQFINLLINLEYGLRGGLPGYVISLLIRFCKHIWGLILLLL